MNYAKLEQNIVAWVKEQEAMRALVVVGSRARTELAADDWSDLDLMLFTTQPDIYVADSTWLHTFGEVWVQVLNETDAGQPEWLIVYEEGLKVDFFLAEVTGDLEAMLFSDLYGMVAQRGVRILLNKDGPTQLQRPLPVTQLQSPSTEEEFTAVTQTFWLYAYRTHNMLQRGELWRVQDFIQRKLRHALMQMVTWHAQATQGPEIDTWYDGRFLEQWADPQVLALLPQTFALNDVADLQRALNVLIGLFNRLTEETADQWQYVCSSDGVNKLQSWLNDGL